MSDNFNDLLLILNLPTDGSILISKVEVHEDTKFIHISTSPSPVFCPNCGCRMHSKGMYARTVNHPVLQDSFKRQIDLQDIHSLFPQDSKKFPL